MVHNYRDIGPKAFRIVYSITTRAPIRACTRHMHGAIDQIVEFQEGCRREGVKHIDIELLARRQQTLRFRARNQY